MDWINKKVLVTGACGFIGSHLVERLLELGAQVRAMVFYNPMNSWGWLEAIPQDQLNRAEVKAGDVRDPFFVRTAVKDIDVIFHLAALISIPYSYISPESYIDTNIKGTLNILQAARDCNVERVCITSTSEVYGTSRYVPMDEQHPLQGQSPYSASKIGADRLAESFHRSFGTPVTIIRPFNTFGPRQSARAVIPTIITQILTGKKEIKLGTLTPTRDLLYVKDTVEGFIASAASLQTIGEEINIATQTETSIQDLAAKIINMMGADSKIVQDAIRMRPEKSEVERLLGSNRKIIELTGWKQRYQLSEGLAETIRWFSDERRFQLYKPEFYNV